MNGPRGPRLTTIGAPHFSQSTPVVIGLTGLPSASTSQMFWHFGYAEHPRNGPRRPSRSTIGAPHLSQTCLVGCAERTGLPSASKFIVVLHSGYLLHPRNGPRRPMRCTIGAPHSGHLCSVSFGPSASLSPVR